MKFPRLGHWIHETVVANYIGLPKGAGEHGQSEALTSLRACIKAGKGGSKAKGNVKATGLEYAGDLSEQYNESGVCFQTWGGKESFKRGNLSEGKLYRSPRWFHFGNEFSFELRLQLNIANELTGQCDTGTITADDPAILQMYQIKRRQKMYKYFYNCEMEECVQYRIFDISMVAAKFIDVWPDVKMSSTKPWRRSFLPQDLELLENNFRLLLISSNIIGKFVLDGHIAP